MSKFGGSKPAPVTQIASGEKGKSADPTPKSPGSKKKDNEPGTRQEVVGEGGATNSATNGYSPSGEIYTAAGDNVGYIDFGSYPSSVKLPSSGSYRLVLEPYGVPRTGTTLTLWDLANVPKSLRDKAASNGETCTSEGGLFGGTSCMSSGVGSSLGEGPSGSCTVTNNTLKCGGTTIGPICPTGAAPSETTVCLPPDIVDQLNSEPSQIGSDGITATATTAPATTTETTPAPTTTAVTNSVP